MVRYVKNPIRLARVVMDKTKHVFVAGSETLELAKRYKLALEPEPYFITEYRVDEYIKKRSRQTTEDQLQEAKHGTCGVVARDRWGNLAAATTTGGMPNALPGRIGDSGIMGAGIFADNNVCAISASGEGEFLIRRTIAHDIAAMIEYKDYSLMEAANHILFTKNSDVMRSGIGVVGIDHKGNIGICFTSERMLRAWVEDGSEVQVKIYR